MEANKWRVLQKSLDRDSKNQDKLQNNSQATVCTPPKSYNKSKRRLDWPGAIFSQSKNSKFNKMFETSEPWFDSSADSKVNSRKSSPNSKRYLFKSSTLDWFKHDHNDQDLNDDVVDEEAFDIEISDMNENDDKQDFVPAKKTQLSELEELYYLKRLQAEELANKQRQESDNWFDYESNLKWPHHFPPNKISSPEVESVKRKYLGHEMKMIFTP